MQMRRLRFAEILDFGAAEIRLHVVLLARRLGVLVLAYDSFAILRHLLVGQPGTFDRIVLLCSLSHVHNKLTKLPRRTALCSSSRSAKSSVMHAGVGELSDSTAPPLQLERVVCVVFRGSFTLLPAVRGLLRRHEQSSKRLQATVRSSCLVAQTSERMSHAFTICDCSRTPCLALSGRRLGTSLRRFFHRCVPLF